MKNFKDYLPEGVKRENRIQQSYSNKQKELSALNRGDHSSVPKPKEKESSEFLFPTMDHHERVNARKSELSTDIESLKRVLSSAKAKNQRRLSNKTEKEKLPVISVKKSTQGNIATTPRDSSKMNNPENDWISMETDGYGIPIRQRYRYEEDGPEANP